MIVADQRNLKVHFAGVERLEQLVAARAAGVNYFLFSAFHLICGEIGIRPIKFNYNVPQLKIPQLIFENSRHCIMDSGLFTLMFGAHKGAKDEALLSRWLENLIRLVVESGFQGTCVEVDCQKVLSTEHAWKFRERMRQALPRHRIINVFHLEDGQRGLDRLIEYADYIAISVPELRLSHKKDYVPRLAGYIKDKKPQIDIHLLGCTELALLDRARFCTSSDSSSWTASERYGEIKTARGQVHVNRFKGSDLVGTYERRIAQVQHRLGVDLPKPRNMASLAFACEQIKAVYTRHAGDQA